MSQAPIYLAVALARAGIAARRQAIELIKAGRVSYNGIITTDPTQQVHTQDTLMVDGKPIAWQHAHQYLVLNKPRGYICSHQDPWGNPTIFELIKPEDCVPGLTYVGRLDQESSGLLLLTNNGTWAQQLQHPRYNIIKVYEVEVDRPLLVSDLQSLQTGTLLDDVMMVPDKIVQDRSKPERMIITLHSGKKRVIRRLLNKYGYEVVHLHRVSYGPIQLGTLAPGHYRPATPIELTTLKTNSIDQVDT